MKHLICLGFSKSPLLGLQTGAVLPGSKGKREVRGNYTLLILHKRRLQISSSGEKKFSLVINSKKCLFSEKKKGAYFLTANVKVYINT